MTAIDGRRRLRRFRRRVGKRSVRWLGPLVLGKLARTWKHELLGSENLERARVDGGGHFMAMWHGRMVVPLPYHRDRNWQVLVSPSEDGDVSEGLLESFGYGVIRGSSSRGGARALREMLTAMDGGAVLAITPDGPRGPMHSMNPGLPWMAKATGRAIVPCGFVCDRAWHLSSWDRFTIPKPRARVTMVYGEPVWVARETSEERLVAIGEELKQAMLAAERRGFEHMRVEPDW